MVFYRCCFLTVISILKIASCQTRDYPEKIFIDSVTPNSLDITALPNGFTSAVNHDTEELKENDELPDKTSDYLRKKCTGQIDLNSKSGEIFTPNYPDPYPSNTTCIWTIHAPEDHHIYIYFHHFDLESGLVNTPYGRFGSPECHFDLLYIHEELSKLASQHHSILQINNLSSDDDSTSETPPEKIVWGVFCGKHTPPPRITETSGSKLVLIFHSDETKEKRGFWATFHTIKKSDLRKLVGKNKNTEDVDFFDDSGWDEIDEYEENAKRAYTAIVLFVFSVVLVLMILHCWQGSPLCEALFPSICMSRPTGSGSNQSVWMNVFQQNERANGDSTNHSLPSIPSPPPAYGEIVKTEEDWQRALQRIGETEESIERHRSHPDNIQVEYDIMGNDQQNGPSYVTSSTGSSIFSTQSSPGPMYDPRGGVVDNLLPLFDAVATIDEGPIGLQTRTSLSNDEIESRYIPEQSSQTDENPDPSNLERNSRPPFCSPLT
ncbi:uncharacterized protein LOC120347522 [Styela clava]